VLKRHKSTISREVRRNRGLRYRPQQAQHLALAHREAKAKPRIAPGTWEWVESLLCEEWSPEQISGWLSGEQGLQVSHEGQAKCSDLPPIKWSSLNVSSSSILVPLATQIQVLQDLEECLHPLLVFEQPLDQYLRDVIEGRII
jgi:hypothetical protein